MLPLGSNGGQAAFDNKSGSWPARGPRVSLNWERVGSLGHNAYVLLSDLVRTSEAVSLTSGRRVKIDEIAALLRRAAPEEIPVAVAFLSGELRQRQIGVGYAALGGLLPAAGGPDGGAGHEPLTLAGTDSVFAEIGATVGPGSQAERRRLLEALFARATPAEQSFLTRLLAGELHQGALEGVMIEAVALAAGVPGAEVRRALLLGGSLPAVAAAALSAARGAHGPAAGDQRRPDGGIAEEVPAGTAADEASAAAADEAS